MCVELCKRLERSDISEMRENRLWWFEHVFKEMEVEVGGEEEGRKINGVMWYEEVRYEVG